MIEVVPNNCLKVLIRSLMEGVLLAEDIENAADGNYEAGRTALRQLRKCGHMRQVDTPLVTLEPEYSPCFMITKSGRDVVQQWVDKYGYAYYVLLHLQDNPDVMGHTEQEMSETTMGVGRYQRNQ